MFSAGPLTIDLARHHVSRDGVEVKLSPKEFAILRELVIHAGKARTHRHMFRAVWGQDEGDQTSLRVFIRQLRVKLEADPARPAAHRTRRRLPAYGMSLAIAPTSKRGA